MHVYIIFNKGAPFVFDEEQKSDVHCRRMSDITHGYKWHALARCHASLCSRHCGLRHYCSGFLKQGL